jgi:hypothetical protein
VNSPYSYDKSPSMDISPPHSYSPLPQSMYSQNGLPSPQKSMSPGYESPYGGHRDLLSTTSASTRQNGGTATVQTQMTGSSPVSPPHSYSPLPHVYGGQNGRPNGNNITNQNIASTTSAPSPTLSAQSGSLHSPGDQQQLDKLWNDKMLENSQCPSTNSAIHHNLVQVSQHHVQQNHHQQHHQNHNSREMTENDSSPTPSHLIQRVSTATIAVESSATKLLLFSGS